MEAKNQLTISFILTILISCSLCQTHESPARKLAQDYTINEFHPESSEPLNLLTLHSNSGNIYVAGDRSLFHLSPDLQLQNNVTNNETQKIRIMEVSENLTSLITCASGEPGGCQIRELSDVTDKKDAENPSLNEGVIPPGNGSIVGLIAHGVEANKESLYVARPVSQFSSPIIERRLMPSGGTDRATLFFNSAAFEKNFVIYYREAFFHNDFVYFLASQKASPELEASTFISKLSRLCASSVEEHLPTFTEIRLRCQTQDGDTDFQFAQAAQVYDNNLYVVFNKYAKEGQPATEYLPGSQSALCVYNITEIEEEFSKAARQCGCEVNDRSNINYLNSAECGLIVKNNEAVCLSDNVQPIIKNFACHSSEFFRYPEQIPDHPLDAAPVFVWNMTFSTVLITRTNVTDHMIAFIGTQEGQLLKVNLDESNGTLYGVYEEVDFGAPILSGTTFADELEETLLVISASEVRSIKAFDCGLFTTCEECIRPGTPMGDPYCGWCTLSSSCTRIEECAKNLEPSRWLPHSESNCSAIPVVSPASLSVEEGSKQLVLTVEHLPALSEDESYRCQFGTSYQSEALMTGEDKLNCTSPPKNTIPAVTKGDNVEVKLQVFSSETGVEFVSTNYPFYDCSKIKSCSQCVNSRWRCDWCKFSHSCTHNSSTCSRGDTVIPGSYVLPNASDQCPQIIRSDDQMYVPNGFAKKLKFKAKHLPPLSNDQVQGYTCHLMAQDNDVASVDFTVAAQIVPEPNDTFAVTCGSKMYSYMKDQQELDTTLTLTWNTNNMIDGAQPIALYKCESGRPDCSRCLSPQSTPGNLDCVWCKTEGMCTYLAHCTTGSMNDCPAPEINYVFPMSAPLGGKTRVFINGTNLGQDFEDITDIFLAGEPCEKINETYYRVGESIECIADASTEEKEGDVVVIVEGGKRGTLEGGFSYRQPVVRDFSPKQGPQSGGTKLTFTGTKLDTGRDVEIMIDSVPCTYDPEARTDEEISCRTGAAGNLVNGVVKVMIDDSEIPKDLSETFGYLQDPNVTKVEPLKTIKSGGIMLNVTGERFYLIQEAKIIAKSNGLRVEQKCHIQTGTTMRCPAPNVTGLMGSQRRRRRQADGNEDPIVIGFSMDGVTSLENWSQNRSVTFEFFPDPTYQPFEKEVLEITRSQLNPIQIEGSNIDVATEKDQVTVHFGDKECRITVFENNLLYCEPPSSRPDNVDRDGNPTERNLPLIVVQHGKFLFFEIGYVRYVTDPIIFYIIAVAVALLLIILIAILIIYCLRKSKNKQLKELELALVELPKDITEELRVLFAMLQTAMSKFETNPDGLPVVPLIDRSEFVKNMLFLNLNIQPTKEPLMASEEIDAMRKFSELIYNKSFLLVFIRTLDKERNLPMMDRVNVASLITLALLLEGKLDYLTDVMVTLMGEEIEDLVEKNRPKQLFKRNESIVEKLVSNWVAICLYNYLEHSAAQKIGQLYSAIQCVVEKGPIDAVSGKSQFSLDDEHMLDSHISFEEVTLQVVANEEDGEIASVNVLDVDTITQVKTKILDHLHRGRPYSTRTSTSEMDLEWRQGLSGQLVLRDDVNQEVVDGWKKINTLRDYKVESGCRVALIKKQANPNATLASRSENLSAAVNCDDTDHNESAFMDLSVAEKTPLNRTPTLVEARVEEGVNLWHLIKEIEAADELHSKSKSKNRLQKKGIKEVLLPLLQTTREALLKYVNEAFDVMLSADNTEVPKCIKYLFDFFDRQATKYNLDNPDIVCAWKNNVLPLRFWTTILASPTYIFDVRQSRYVEACLRVLVQVLRDACSKSDFKLDKNSSPSRLLFNSMLPKYTSQVETYYRNIQELPRLNPDATKEEFTQISQPFSGLFDSTHTMFQLYQFAKRFNESLNAALEEDDDCQNANLVYRMEQVGITLNE